MFLQELFWLKIDTYYSNLNACHGFFYKMMTILKCKNTFIQKVF